MFKKYNTIVHERKMGTGKESKKKRMFPEEICLFCGGEVSDEQVAAAKKSFHILKNV